jgi:low temperature requirement protein LtrA
MMSDPMEDESRTEPIPTEEPTEPLEPEEDAADADALGEPDHHVEPKERVAPLELFFDLVFVFAFTQVTAYMSANDGWEGLGEGLLILFAVWWAWGAYAWMTNFIDPDETLARLAVFGSMGAMLVAALAIPGAFGDDGVLFGCAYFVVRALHILFFAYANDDVNVAQAVRLLSFTALPAPALLIVAGFLDGGAQISLWIIALAIDYAGPYLTGVDGYRVSPAHFAERFGLIIIIALGESIVAVGVGAEGITLGAGEVVAALAAVAIAGSLWWAYFDVVAVVAERRFRTAPPPERNRIARDSYSYLHMPMIAGIVLLALGIKKTLGYVDEPLETVPAVALCGGVAIYLIAHVAFRWRNVHTINKQRTLAAFLCLALIPFATTVASLAALLAIGAVTVGLVVYEAIRFSDARQRIRDGAGPSDLPGLVR